MSDLYYLSALALALADEMAADPAVCVFGEDIGAGLTGITRGLLDQYGPERVLDMPLSEQAFTGFATGAALSGLRPVIEFQIPSLLYLVFEQIVNQAHKFSPMTGGQASVPVTYLVSGSGSRMGMAGQHSDHPYSMFVHAGIKTVVPASPLDAYSLFRSAIRDPDPVVLFAPSSGLMVHEPAPAPPLPPVPLGSARIHRSGQDVTVVAVGHLVHTALEVAEELSSECSVEVFDPRTLHPFDWPALAESLGRTGRLVVVDDSNRSCGFAAEVIATAAEEMVLKAPPKRVTRADMVVPFALELDVAVQPAKADLTAAVRAVLKN